jgi:hypothetical protein
MGTRAPETPVSEEAAFSVLAKDLDTAKSPKRILQHLNALHAGLCDSVTAGERARSFLLADGLPAVIRHLCGIGTSDNAAHLMSCAVSVEAANVLTELLRHMDAPMWRSTTTAETLQLTKALKSAPTLLGCCVATRALLKIAEAQPTQHEDMANADVFRLVHALYKAIRAEPRSRWDPFMLDTVDQGAALARVLVRSETVAVDQLRDITSGAPADGVFDCLFIVQVSLLILCACDFASRGCSTSALRSSVSRCISDRGSLDSVEFCDDRGLFIAMA